MAFAWPDAAHRFCFDSNYDWIWWICQSIIPKTSKNCCFQALFLVLSELPLRDHVSLAWYLLAGIWARSIYRRSHFFSRFLSPFVLNLDSWSRSIFQRCLFLVQSKVSARSARFVFCILFLLINRKYAPCLGCRFRHHFGIFICFWFLVSISRYSPYLWFEVGQIS